MIPKSTDGKQRVLSLSYGKDSMACLGALEALQWPLDRIVTADVWATETIPADLPPMVEFKDYADKVIKERYGIEVEHFFAVDKAGYKSTYEDGLQKEVTKQRSGEEDRTGMKRGFPYQKGSWCQRDLKAKALDAAKRTFESQFYKERKSGGAIQYIGIAADEPNRFHGLNDTKLSPLVEIGWTESDCRQWCEDNDLLSPIYTKATRGGCWFCHNQGVNQLRLLRKDYPELWALLLKWDSDSPVTFHADGHTVHDFEQRFQLEDEGFIYPTDRVFRWSMLDEELNYRLF